jgi:hypothetical protein
VSTEREEILARRLTAMTLALRHVASRDCEYLDSNDRPQPCDCPPCTAQQALATENEWRFLGGGVERLEHNPRERKIVAAWRQYMSGFGTGTPDYKLAQILREVDPDSSVPTARRGIIATFPTPRDWYVATTIIQWLATNVGSSILSAAGYHYDNAEERAELEKRSKAYLAEQQEAAAKRAGARETP